MRLPVSGEAHEVLQVSLVRPSRARIVEIGKPLGFGRHRGEPVEFGSRQRPVQPVGDRAAGIGGA